jgi:regulatory protein
MLQSIPPAPKAVACHGFLLLDRHVTEQAAGTITALVAQKRNKSRVNVFIDGEFAFGLSAINAVALRKGQRLTPGDVERLEREDAAEVAHERALNFLSYRPRSEWEVRDRLKKNAKGDFPPEILDEVVTRLENVGLLDDGEFARYWVSNRDQFKPRSKFALRHELRGKRVSDADIESALADYDEEDAALRAAQKRASRLAGLDRQTFNKRLGDFLARRGFNYEVSREVIEQVWDSIASETVGDLDDSQPEAK